SPCFGRSAASLEFRPSRGGEQPCSQQGSPVRIPWSPVLPRCHTGDTRAGPKVLLSPGDPAAKVGLFAAILLHGLSKRTDDPRATGPLEIRVQHQRVPVPGTSGTRGGGLREAQCGGSG